MNKDGLTALMWAALHDHIAMMTLLLDRGTSIDSTDKVESLFIGVVRWRICLLKSVGWREQKIRIDLGEEEKSTIK